MSITTPEKPDINLVIKIFDCLFSGLTIATGFYFLIGPISLILGIIVLIAAAALLIVWNYHENNEAFPSEKTHALLLDVIRHSVAYIISVYGFAKILKTQFGIVYSRNDTPVGLLSGFDLTWNYFAYSYKFAVLIASLQIGGAILLMFRRTMLAGECLLLPVMINILLIDIVYSINTGALLVCTLLSSCLLYLLILNRKPIINLFFYTTDKLVRFKKFKVAVWVLKGIIPVLAFFSVYKYLLNQKPVDILGKWKVEKIKQNGASFENDAWMTNDDAWQNVYVEDHGVMLFSPNPYIFDRVRAKIARFELDSSYKNLELTFMKDNKPTDLVVFKISNKSSTTMQWRGRYKNDDLEIFLKKVETEH